MNQQEAEKHYSDKGLVTYLVVDEPNEYYKPHQHGEVYLYTLSGSAEIKLDGGVWQSTEISREIHISTDQLHEVRVGDNGWKYIFASSSEEARRQGLL